MKAKKESESAEYRVGNTNYQVTPIFQDAPGAEHIADKIERMILNRWGEKAQ